jgi:hypothetical protein
MNRVIIHISGASGSGKTTLGNKLKQKFKNEIVVKDIDDLKRDFIKKFDIIQYQLYIDNFVKKHSLKPLIFVGFNNILDYNMHSTYNYFIDLDDETIIKQKCKQLLNIFANDYNMKMLVSNNKQYIKNLSIGIDYECNLKNKLKEDYMKRGYKFMSRENIFKNISKILQY